MINFQIMIKINIAQNKKSIFNGGLERIELSIFAMSRQRHTPRPRALGSLPTIDAFIHIGRPSVTRK